MCKRHWKLIYAPEQEEAIPDATVARTFTAGPTTTTTNEGVPEAPSPPLRSVYESILPASISFRPPAPIKQHKQQPSNHNSIGMYGNNNNNNNTMMDPFHPPPAPEGVTVMPLVAHLQEGSTHKPAGWHRNEERLARGLAPIGLPTTTTTTTMTDNNNHDTLALEQQQQQQQQQQSIVVPLEAWERQLAVVEILLLGGGTPYANFQHLAHGWGRTVGFHTAIINGVCERRGDIIRKRKHDLLEGSGGGGGGVAAVPHQQQQQQQQQPHTNDMPPPASQQQQQHHIDIMPAPALQQPNPHQQQYQQPPHPPAIPPPPRLQQQQQQQQQAHLQPQPTHFQPQPTHFQPQQQSQQPIYANNDSNNNNNNNNNKAEPGGEDRYI